MPILERLMFASNSTKTSQLFESVSELIQEIYELSVESRYGTLIPPKDYDPNSHRKIPTSEGYLVSDSDFLLKGRFKRMVTHYLQELNGKAKDQSRESLG